MNLLRIAARVAAEPEFDVVSQAQDVIGRDVWEVRRKLNENERFLISAWLERYEEESGNVSRIDIDLPDDVEFADGVLRDIEMFDVVSVHWSSIRGSYDDECWNGDWGIVQSIISDSGPVYVLHDEDEMLMVNGLPLIQDLMRVTNTQCGSIWDTVVKNLYEEDTRIKPEHWVKYDSLADWRRSAMEEGIIPGVTSVGVDIVPFVFISFIADNSMGANPRMEDLTEEQRRVLEWVAGWNRRFQNGVDSVDRVFDNAVEGIEGSSGTPEAVDVYFGFRERMGNDLVDFSNPDGGRLLGFMDPVNASFEGQGFGEDVNFSATFNPDDNGFYAGIYIENNDGEYNSVDNMTGERGEVRFFGV